MPLYKGKENIGKNIKTEMAHSKYPENATQGTPEVPTLYNAIEQLSEISWSLNSLVFGERPAEKPQDTLIAGDKITQARNQLQSITERLREIKDRLEIIGG